MSETQALLAVLEEHEPDYLVDPGDSVSLVCSCGWEDWRAKEPWIEHVRDAICEAADRIGEALG